MNFINAIKAAAKKCGKHIGRKGWPEDTRPQITEFCPVCENETEFKWDVKADGYNAFCPHCGAKLLLCDSCEHDPDTGEYIGGCDWRDGACKHSDHRLTRPLL